VVLLRDVHGSWCRRDSLEAGDWERTKQMDHSTRGAQVFVELADTLIENFEVVDFCRPSPTGALSCSALMPAV
jgi:hypothetical protein